MPVVRADIAKEKAIAPERQALECPEGGLERVYKLGQFWFAIMGTRYREECYLLVGGAPNDDLAAAILCVTEDALANSFNSLERMLAQRPFRPTEAFL